MYIVIRVVFLIGKLMDHSINHFDWWIMGHLNNQIFTQIIIIWMVGKEVVHMFKQVAKGS
jgi:hypothetical protein